MNDRDAQRLRLRDEIEECGKDRIIRYVLRDGDPFVMFGLLETLAIPSEESVGLMAAFITLRGRSFPLEDLVTWKKRARSYLLHLIGEAPEPERLLAN